MKKRRLLIAVVTAMALVIPLSKPASLNVYAKAYHENDVNSFTILQEGDKLLFPEWGYKTQGMTIRYFSEKNQVQQNISVDPGEDYEIPDYDDLKFNDPIPEGRKFAGWSVMGKPNSQTRELQWDLKRCLEAAPEPTDTPTTAPEPTDTPTTAPEPTDTPTTAPDPTDTPTTVPEPTDTPTTVPIPTAVATMAPTAVPTAVPTSAPTLAPTAVPTAAPTAVPTMAPTAVPTAAPTAVPTMAPTAVPTAVPTSAPTLAPTAVPTVAPTAMPTQAPATAVPTAVPSPVPTATPEPDIQNTVISQAGTYQLQPYIMYLLKGGITHVEGDITSYANSISFTVDSSSAYTFY